MLDYYSENILDYYRNPRNKGSLTGAQITARDSNPLCGDEVSIFLKLNGEDKKNEIMQARFEGVGCAISMASVSMLCEAIEGKSLDEARSIDKQFVFSMLGVQLSPIRVKCALLSLKVLKLGIYNYLGQQLQADEGEFT